MDKYRDEQMPPKMQNQLFPMDIYPLLNLFDLFNMGFYFIHRYKGMYLESGIAIDDFSTGELGDKYFLTHWHGDHIKGLNSEFKDIVLCSHVTAQLLQEKYPRIRCNILNLNQKVQLNERTSVIALDANHLPGSIMLYFPELQVFYTGDYRLNEPMLENIRQTVAHRMIHSLYVDGTYHHMSLRFLSEIKSRSIFEKFLDDHPGSIAVGIHHVGLCALIVGSGYKFSIDESISSSLARQINILYPYSVKPDQRLLLVNPRYFISSCTLLIPSSLWFACAGNASKVDTPVLDKKGRWRLNYTRHSDFWDNSLLQQTLNAKQMIPVGPIRVNLACR